MEHTIIHNDLVDREIKPQELLNRYMELLAEDITKILHPKQFKDYGCPTCAEKKDRGSFTKFNLNYKVSETYGNIYLSPRPNQDQLFEFYKKSKARAFWLKELWPVTETIRRQKIIGPQLDWINTLVQEYLGDKFLAVAEYYPNQWGYCQEAQARHKNWEYSLVDPMFDAALVSQADIKKKINESSKTKGLYDAIFLFDALDRAPDPAAALKWVFAHLKEGGLCFVTCLLSSGLEVQVLGEESKTFLPPERLNVFSYEGLNELIKVSGNFKIIEFSTPGVLDLQNIIEEMPQMRSKVPSFIRYIIETRKDPDLLEAFQDFLQMNKLSSFGRLVLRKPKAEK